MSARLSVTLKLATSLDGRIATASGESKWITGEAARAEVHRLRAAHAAVLVGSQTVLDDDPALTVRLEGYAGAQPLRVVADGRGRTPGDAAVLDQAVAPSLIVTRVGAARDAWRTRGARLAEVEGGGGEAGVAPAHVLEAIGEALAALGRSGEGARVLLEGGGMLAASFLREGLVDDIEWFRAPLVLGAEGRPAVGGLALGRLADAPRFARTHVAALGDDLWERYRRAARDE